jgi:ISXO2 transposase-like protein/transposase-like zinc ribbon protein
MVDTTVRSPKTLVEAISYYSDPDVTLATMVEARWPAGVTCPTCGAADPRFISTRRLWECRERHERRQFSAKVGTIFEDSPLPLEKWFPAVWLIANAKNGVSSHEVGRALGVTQKTAWFMLHRIRLAMKAGTFMKLSGKVEADETWIGPDTRKMHAKRLAKRRESMGMEDGKVSQAIIAGLLERAPKGSKRKSRVRAEVVPTTQAFDLIPPIKDNVAVGSEMITDMNRSYWAVRDQYIHSVIDHTKMYVKGHVHTNGIENFWSLLKRMIHGTYVGVSSYHLGAYVDEEVFRFNERGDDDGGRFGRVLRQVTGRRLTYETLINRPALA